MAFIKLGILSSDDHTFSTTSTTGTIDRRRRTLMVATVALVIIAIVATTTGVVLLQQSRNNNSNNTSSSGKSSTTNQTEPINTISPRPSDSTLQTSPIAPTSQAPASAPTVLPSMAPSVNPSLLPSYSVSSIAPVDNVPYSMIPSLSPDAATLPTPIQNGESDSPTEEMPATPTAPSPPTMPTAPIITETTAPVTTAPVTAAPVTIAPVTIAPVTAAPMTSAPYLDFQPASFPIQPIVSTTSPGSSTTEAPNTMPPATPTPPSILITTARPTLSSPTTTTTKSPHATFAPVWHTYMPLAPTLSPITPQPTVFTPVLNQVEQVIRSVALFGGDEFLEFTSYQSKAMHWLQQDAQKMSFTSSSSTNDDTKERRWIQRYALACLYYATYAISHKYTMIDLEMTVAPGWLNDDGWLTSTSECTWFRVTCNDDGFVQALELYQNRLTGHLPRELTLLKASLKRLDLFDSYIWNKGDEGNAWLGQLTQLEYLYYGNTYFEYSSGVPTQIAQLTNLIEYDCSYTFYSGPLQESAFVGLDQLEYLVLSYNDYSAPLPLSLVELPSLEWLYVTDADLTGSLDFMTSFSLLRELWMDYNRITGGIPTKGIPSTLVSWSATDNLFTGTIPTTLGSLTRMEQLWLYNNSLTGTIPSELGRLSSLRTLFVHGNDLSGKVPLQICTLSNLKNLVIDCYTGPVCSCCTGCFE